MTTKKLAEMDFDEFVDNALDESVVSTDTSEHSPKHERNSKAKKHKAVLSKLAEDDPEFYTYLLDNDKQLLEFELSDESGSEATDSGSEEGAVETVSESHSESDNETPALKSIDSDLSDAEDNENEVITKKQV